MLFADLICQKCPETLIFFMIFMWNRALATISRTFCQVLRTCQFFLAFFNVKPSSRCSRVHFLWITFADRGPQPRKQRPYLGDHGSHGNPRKHRGLRPRAFSSRNSRVPDLLHFPTFPNYFLMMMMMMVMMMIIMMRLTWWWGCWPWQSP